MHKLLSHVKAVGFDLDRTLYQDTPEMLERINQKVFKAILRFRPELQTIEQVRAMYGTRLEKFGRWTVLKEAGIQNYKEICAQCAHSANIIDLIEPDQKLVGIMKALKKRFYLFVLTRSRQGQSFKKLRRIGIRPEIFSFSLFGDDPYSLSTVLDKNFLYFLSQSPFRPTQHVFIGDDLEKDVSIPKSLGLKTILVGRYSSEADFCISHIHKIENLLL